MSTVSSSTSTKNTTNGIISGMDIDTIIEKTMAVARLPEQILTDKKTALNDKVTAWQDINSLVLSLDTAAKALNNADTFDTKSITSSDNTILTALASTDASVGTYTVTVNSLSAAQQIASQGYSSATSAVIGTGTISIKVGDGTAVDVSVDSTDNTLIGLRDAINNANLGATASIINDGTSSPYHLVITSNTGGTAGQMTITSNLSDGTNPTLTQMQAASDASVTIGQGDGAITVTGTSNTLKDAIPGLTLYLQSANQGKTLTLDVSADTSTIGSKIATWIDSYNGLMDAMTTQFTYDSTSETSPALFGDTILETMQTQLQSYISTMVSGASSDASLLSQVGITMDGSTNHLSLNATTLMQSLSDGGTKIEKLFSTIGLSSSNNVTYVTSTSGTKSSGTNGYAIEITQAATHARVTSGVAQDASLLADETLTLNGKEIQLTTGMTQAQVVTAINAYSDTTGVAASATGSDGTGTGHYLTFTSLGYGSSKAISVQSSLSNGGSITPTSDTSGTGNVKVTQSDGTGESGLGTAAAGLDVAGTINGEAATGKGQVLTGNSSNANTAGLTLKITAATAGSYGKVTFSKGIAAMMAGYTSAVTDSIFGIITTTKTSLTDQISDLGDQISTMEDMLTAKQDYLVAQYAKMESAMSKLNNQGTYIKQMFYSDSDDD